METQFEVPEVCRMCMDDLSTADEYYSIDDDLQTLLKALTGISVDLNDSSLSLIMCTNCSIALNQFNELRNCWVDNQQKFLDHQDRVEDEAVSDVLKEEFEGQHTIESQFFMMENSQPDFDYSVEYVDELEFNDTSATAAELIDTENEEKFDTVMIQKGSPSSKSKKKNSEAKEKGKSIYQKLLKKCDHCGKLIEKNRMEGHINKHLNVKPFVCELLGCNKSFYCRLLLRLHQTSIHTGKDATCNICKKVFPSERSLYSHMLRHKNENRYNCDFCPRKFNNSNSLKRHLAIHSGIREFTCEYCTSSFYRKFNLDVHVKTVHEKDKSYSCQHCPKKFGYARLLRNHCEKSHPEAVSSRLRNSKSETL